MTSFAPFFPQVGRPLKPGEAMPVPSTSALQIHYVQATAAMLAVSGAVLCLAITAALWSSVPAWLLLPWTGAILVSLLPVPVMLHGLSQRVFSDAEARILVDWIARFSVLRALLWGLGAAVFFHYATPIQVTILSVLVLGNAMGSSSALMSIPRAASLFALCSVLPLALTFMISGRFEMIIVGALLSVYALGLRSAAGQTFNFIKSESQLRGDLIDKQAQLEHAKIEAESSNRTKSDFVAHMSHELRTPLNAIIGFSDVISSEMFGAVAPRYVNYAKDINESGRHLLALINDVLDLSRVESGVLTIHESEVDIGNCATVVERLVRERALKKRIALKWDCSDAPRVISDERLVQQIVINLVTNAIKFTPDGGIVTVSARAIGSGDVAICVADNGVGMTAAEIDVAMTPFGQVGSNKARAEGTGLGLPLCDRFARALGGTLAIDSTPGQGTTVMLTLPSHYVVPSAQAVDEAKLEAVGT